MNKLNAALKIINPLDEDRSENKQRSALIQKAAEALLEIVQMNDSASFRIEEDALAQALSEIGLGATRKILQGYSKGMRP